MPDLPPLAEQEWILEALAGLIREQGAERFLTAPLFEPSDQYFPDPWTPDRPGVERMVRRLLRGCGLGALDVSIDLEKGNPHAEVMRTSGVEHDLSHKGAAAWFCGIEGGTALFGVDVEQLTNPEALVGTLSHEVAHAFRHRQGLVVRDHEHEERLTDLTTLYLGYGILTTNNAYRYCASTVDGGMFGSRWQYEKIGYLSLEALSFGLALQTVIRGEKRSFAEKLERNQAAAFKSAYDLLAERKAELRRRLGLPAVGPVPELKNAGQVVFRERRTGAAWIVGAALGFASSIAAILLRNAALHAGWLLFPAVVGAVYRFAPWRCAGCRVRLAGGELICPGCGGVLAGAKKYLN